MALTDIKLRHLKPGEKAYIEADGGGLFIEVTPKGTKVWKLRYRTWYRCLPKRLRCSRNCRPG